MILHECPDTTILELLAGKPETRTRDSGHTAAVISTGLAPSGPKRTKYAVLGTSPTDGAGGEYLELKPSKAAEVKFDLVILGQGCKQSINRQLNLPFLLEHVKPGGLLICGFNYGSFDEPVPQDCQVDVFADDTDPVTFFFAAPAAAVADEDSNADSSVSNECAL